MFNFKWNPKIPLGSIENSKTFESTCKNMIVKFHHVEHNSSTMNINRFFFF